MSSGICVLIAITVLISAIDVEGRSPQYNQTCSDLTFGCDYYAGLTCDAGTQRCVCEENTKYDIGQRQCRRLHCFETCLQPGYECKSDRCQICWTADNRYLCDNPERIYIPVAIAVAATAGATISLWLLLMLCCCCRRNFRAVTSYIVVQSQQYSRLATTKSPKTSSEQPKSSNPFASSWRVDEQQQQQQPPQPQVIIRDVVQQTSSTAEVTGTTESVNQEQLPPAYDVAKAPPTPNAS